jgi:tRNA U34 5-carboxymethylaminomethyl modifying GTPase MnmE/TrmE
MDKKLYTEDIICAKASAAGTCAISVIRGSGKNSHRIINRIFSPNKPVPVYESHMFDYGRIIDEERIIDDFYIN